MKTPDLFDLASSQLRRQQAPLAERMRPRTLEEYLGQTDLLQKGKILRSILDEAPASWTLRPFPSMIFWGPPGTGKTTLARLIAHAAEAEFVTFSAVSSGVKEAREVIERARERLHLQNRRTILFVDEIHRFNKSQQDGFLPAVEDGTISLIGATTENPSFELNSALLSRARVFVLKGLEPADIALLIERALRDNERGLGMQKIEVPPEAFEVFSTFAGGDARTALNALELAAAAARPDAQGKTHISAELAKEALQKNTILYDKTGEEHYNLISALHKSIRHSDPDASLYYLARMIEGGEDPLFIVRRLVRAASEDIGLADPGALAQTIAAKEAVELLGYPECDTALAQATIYLACAPKSNSVYTAVKAGRQEVKASGPLPVPLYYRNAPTELMKELGYGKNYKYDHDAPQKMSAQEAMPDTLVGRKFFIPGELGFEKEIKKRLEYFEHLRDQLRASKKHS